MLTDIALNKIAAIERCLARVPEEYRGDPARLEQLVTQDSVVLNLQRACESAIDLAMHVVAVRRLGVPQDARNAFDLLTRDGVLDATMASRLKAMVGLRNIAVRQYEELQLPILVRILNERLGDFSEFAGVVRRL